MKKSSPARLSLTMIEPLGEGGWARYSFCLLSRLAPRLGRVVLFTASSTPWRGENLPFRLRPSLFGVSNRLIAFFRLQRFRRLRRLLKALELPLNHFRILAWCLARKPDILHFQAAYWLEALIIPLYSRLGIRLFYTAHDLLHHPPYPGDRFLFRRLYRKLDGIIVTAQVLKRRLIEEFGVEAEKIAVIRMGNIDDPEAPPGVSPARARSELGLPAGDPVVLFFGIIREYKGLDILLRAFALLPGKVDSARLLIAGEPIGDFAPYQEEIDRLRIGGRVKIFAGFIPPDRTPLFFSAADLVVLPYRESYTSAVIPLAYSYGRPVVASRVGGLGEYVSEGMSGYTFEPGDSQDLAEKISFILSDRETAGRMERFIPAYYRDNFSWEEIADATRSFYLEGI
ncbi:MAG: glycosyltransferase family 4 protein [Candidatus Erginobacter occultus]|nr:glycosyltransferase family 4 protein [Candidatus Erginobacter occultus]